MSLRSWAGSCSVLLSVEIATSALYLAGKRADVGPGVPRRSSGFPLSGREAGGGQSAKQQLAPSPVVHTELERKTHP